MIILFDSCKRIRYFVSLLFVGILFFLACPLTAQDANVAAVRDLGPLPFLKVIDGRDGGYSARFADKSVWVFGDTLMSREGEAMIVRSSTWCWTKDFDAHDGLTGLSEPVDMEGLPGEFLPFTKNEAAFNKANSREDLPDSKRRRWALWPGPIAVDTKTGTAYVFYTKVLAGFVDSFDFEVVGNSIAVWESPDSPVVRPKVRVGAEAPTILFPKGDAFVGQGAVVVGDWIYVYGCETKHLSWPCIIARVKMERVLKRNEWRFYAGQGRWSRDWHDAVPIMDAAPMLTVHWNKHLGKYLAVYSTPLRNSISIRTSDVPEGPWSPSKAVVEGLPPGVDKKWDYSGLAHPEFARDNGRMEYFTYYRETGLTKGETRLVEVVFR